MKAFIILSAGQGLLESKPLMCGGSYPPKWHVPILDSLLENGLPRFSESVSLMEEHPKKFPVLIFRRTDKYQAIQDGLYACIYELEGVSWPK